MTNVRATARFVLVGLICAATHNAIVIAASWWQIHYAPACVISFLVVVVLGFALHVRFTFEQRATAASFWRYSVSMAANYPITLVLLFSMCDMAKWPIAVAAPVATLLLFVWNFLASRWAITRKPLAPQSPSPSRPV